jgi:hypothetical protein
MVDKQEQQKTGSQQQSVPQPAPPGQGRAAPPPQEEKESRADKMKRVLESYRHNLQHNAPRSAAELADLEDLLGVTH